MSDINGSGGDDGYEIGYGKPPKATRFKAGTSGNPKGRPKGPRSISALVQEELNRKQEVIINGRRTKFERRQVMVRQQADKAMRGDQKAFALLMKLDEVGGGGRAANVADDADIHEISDERVDEIMQAYVRRAMERSGG